MQDQTLLTTEQAASYLGISKAFLERDRWRRQTVPFVRIGTRSVRYRQSDLNDIINAGRVSGSRGENSYE